MGFLRKTLRRVLPNKVRDFLWYIRNRDLRLALAASDMIKQKLGCTVMTGPFRGMKYVETSFGSTYPPKLLGTYELELHPLMEKLRGESHERILDIGAAEGYYAIGLARLYPGAQMIAYEMQEAAHPIIRDLAQKNGVADRVTVRGTCTPELLQADLVTPGKYLIVVDCEGAEDFLLVPDKTPALAGADLLIETHDFAVPGIDADLRRRFATTHIIEVITTRPRTPSDWPKEADFIPQENRAPAMAEHRPTTQTWLWMKAKLAR